MLLRSPIISFSSLFLIISSFLIEMIHCSTSASKTFTIVGEPKTSTVVDLENILATAFTGDYKLFPQIFRRIQEVNTLTTIPNSSQLDVLRSAMSSLYTSYSRSISTASIPTGQDVVLLPTVNTVTNTYYLASDAGNSFLIPGLALATFSLIFLFVF